MQTNFADLGLSEAALRAVDRLGFEQATPVQAATIPLILEGRDVVAGASTGTGKTAAFLLPTMANMAGTKKAGRKPRMLVVSPTRELAQQIARTCMQIAKTTGQYVTTVFGGSSYTPQIKDLKRGTDILIATPGRLNDLIDRGVAKLGEVEVLVLDEADRMLDMGFLPDMKKIIAITPETRQTLLFSATIDHTIMNSIGTLLKDPALVEIAHKGETAKTVEQFVMPIAHRNKPELLRAVLDEKGSDRVIVFARTKHRTEECMEMLRDNGYSAESIHSDKSQGQRRKALENFRRGRTSILVATDVLARGIDVADVDHVINLDLPDCPEDYVHRIGRTGRAGESGYAISFVSRETRNTLRDIEKLIGKEIPFMELETYELDQSVLTKQNKGKRYGGANKHNGSGSRPKGSWNGSKRPYEGKRSGDASRQGGSDAKERGFSQRSEGGKRPGDFNRKPARDGRPQGDRDHARSGAQGENRRSFEKSDRREGSSNYSNAAKRAASSKKTDDRSSKPKKQHSKNDQSTYNYSRFA